MSDMKRLLEKMTQFAGQAVGQKPGDQVRGTEKATKRKDNKHPFAGRLVGASESKSLLADLEKELVEGAVKRSLAEQFAEFKETRVAYDKRTGQMGVDNTDPDQRHGLYINGKLIKTVDGADAANNLKKRDPRFKDATVKKIAESDDMFADRQSQKIGAAIIKAGKGAIADAPISWEGDEDMIEFTIGDGNDMIKIGKTYIEQGMAAGNAAFWEVDTAVRDQMYDAVLDVGIDMNDILDDLDEGVDIGQEWMSDTELDQYIPANLQQQWSELLGYDRNGNPSALWANLTGGYEPDVNDPEHRALMVKVANKWFAAKKIPNVKFYNVKDADDELEWLVQIGPQDVTESTNGKLPGFLSYVLANSQGQFSDIEQIEDLFDYAYLSDLDLETIADGANEEGVSAIKWATPRMAWLLKHISDKSKLAVIKPLAASWLKTVAPAIDQYVKDVLSEQGISEAPRKPRKPAAPQFTKYTNYELWERERYARGANYSETEIDGRLVGVAVVGTTYNEWGYVRDTGKVVGMWYNKAGIGSFVQDGTSVDDSLSYAEQDTTWPYMNESQGVAEGEFAKYENGEMDESDAVAAMFTRLAKQGRDPIDLISHKFGWGTYELDDLAQQHGFNDSAEWLNSFNQGVAEAEDHTELLALADRHEKTGKWEWSQGNYEGAKQHYAKANKLRDRAKKAQGVTEEMTPAGEFLNKQERLKAGDKVYYKGRVVGIATGDMDDDRVVFKPVPGYGTNPNFASLPIDLVSLRESNQFSDLEIAIMEGGNSLEELDESRLIHSDSKVNIFYKPGHNQTKAQMVARMVPNSQVDRIIASLVNKFGVKSTDFEWQPGDRDQYKFTNEDAESFGYKSLHPEIFKARQQFPMAKSDMEALLMYVQSQEEQDIDRVDRVNDREDAEIEQLDKEEDSLESRLEALTAQLEKLKTKAKTVKEEVPAPVATAGGPAGANQPKTTPPGATPVVDPAQQALLKQNQSKLQQNLANLKSAGVQIDPAKAAQTLQKTDTGAPMNAMDKDTIAQMAPAIGNVMSNPQTATQLNTLIKKAGGGV